MNCSMPCFCVLTISLHLLKLMFIESVMPSNQLSHPLSPPSPLAFNLSQHQGLFQWVHCSHQVAKGLELQLYHLSFQRIFRVISFKIDWFDLLTLRVFSSTTVRRHQFFSAHPSLWSCSHIHTWLLEKPYLWLDGPSSAVMSLLFNTLSRFVIAFLLRNKCLLMSWLQSPSAVILKWAQENEIWHCFHFFFNYFLWNDVTRCHDLHFLKFEF